MLSTWASYLYVVDVSDSLRFLSIVIFPFWHGFFRLEKNTKVLALSARWDPGDASQSNLISLRPDVNRK